MIYLAWIISLIAVFFLGYYQREIKEKLISLQKQLDEKRPEVGATNPYHVVNENKMLNSHKNVGSVLPKSPQLLEFEEQEKIRKMNQASV